MKTVRVVRPFLENMKEWKRVYSYEQIGLRREDQKQLEDVVKEK